MTTHQSTAFGHHRLGAVPSKHQLFQPLAETNKQTKKKKTKLNINEYVKYILFQSPHTRVPSDTLLKLPYCGKEQLISTKLQKLPSY